MIFQLNIDKGLAEPDARFTAAHMLREVADRLEAGSRHGYVLDAAGGRAGAFDMMEPYRPQDMTKECWELLDPGVRP